MSERVITDPRQVDAGYLSRCLGTPVSGFTIETGSGAWSTQVRLHVDTPGGRRVLRLKCCTAQFGRSEVDYYLADYAGLPDAPLVPCLDGRFEAGTGYHLLLEDLSDRFADRRDRAPTLEHFMAVAEALARLHRHQWASQAGTAPSSLDAFYGHVRGGLDRLAALTGVDMGVRLDRLEAAMRTRVADPAGQTLLHGDLNPTNILAPANAEHPVFFLDRQPFDWSITYGLAAADLAYAIVPWSPPEFTRGHAPAIVRHWHAGLGIPGYSWEQAWSDWKLGVEQCLCVPVQWCTDADDAQRMRWLWEEQLRRVLAYDLATNPAANPAVSASSRQSSASPY